MRDARVLVVDDSAAMRALFSNLLEQTRQIEVVGTAASAAEARDMLDDVKPNVLTLDVEMPGMSGMEFLEEIMATRPMPVVMLSSLTQKGADASLKAYDLGAVECFPKPLNVSPEQFNKIVSKLGKIVHAAANSNVRDRPRAVAKNEGPAFVWNGKIVALSASMGGIDALSALLPEFPADCPPVVVVLQTEPELAEAFVGRLSKEHGATVTIAQDGATLLQGTIHIAADPSRHLIVEAGDPPRIRWLDREPVDGFRPSANMLYATIARANLPAVGAVLTGIGDDGSKGLLMLRNAGNATFAQSRADAMVSHAPAAALESGAAEEELGLAALATRLLAECRAQ